MKKSYTFAKTTVLFVLLVFIMLAGIYIKTGSFSFDQPAFEYLYDTRSPFLNLLFVFITTTGNVFSIIVFSLASMTVLFYLKKKTDAVNFGINILGVWLFNELLKYIFKRPRPSVLRLVSASGYSFPSGHAMIFMGFAVLLVYYILTLSKNRKRALTISAIIFIYALAVGVSRVYLGVHYLSDVLAGWSAGIFYSLLSLSIYDSACKKP